MANGLLHTCLLILASDGHVCKGSFLLPEGLIVYFDGVKMDFTIGNKISRHSP